MSEILKFVKTKLAGDPKPDVIVLERDDDRGSITLETLPASEDSVALIESAMRDDLVGAASRVDFTLKLQTRDGRACGARTYRRKGLGPAEGSSSKIESRLVDLVGSTLERTAAMQSGLYDRLQAMIRQQEAIIVKQNDTIAELAAAMAETGGVQQDAGQKFALERVGELAGKALPLLGAMVAKQNGGGAAVAPAGYSGKYAKLRAAIASLPDEDYESLGLWIKEADVGADILARLSEGSRGTLITIITTEGI